MLNYAIGNMNGSRISMLFKLQWAEKVGFYKWHTKRHVKVIFVSKQKYSFTLNWPGYNVSHVFPL